jgi:hypothetical protein
MGAVMERIGREMTIKGHEDRSLVIKLKFFWVRLRIVFGSVELQSINQPSASGRFDDQLARRVDPKPDVAGSQVGSPTLIIR